MTPRAAVRNFAFTMRDALHALLFLRVELRGDVLAGLLGVGVAILVQLQLDAAAFPDAKEMDLWSLSLVANLGLLCCAALLLLAWSLGAVQRAVALAAHAGAMAFWVLAVRYVMVSVNVLPERVAQWVPLACWLWWSLAVLVLAVRVLAVQRWRTVLAVAFVPLVCWPRYTLGELNLWLSETPESDVTSAAEIDTETTYYQQDQLNQKLLRTVKAGIPGVVELYFVGFAGDGSEDVFMKEVTYVRDLMQKHYGEGHAVALINNPTTVDELPLANRHNLEQVLRGIGERMNRDEDILFVYFSSHGSQDNQLSVFLDAMNLDDLEPQDVKNALSLAQAKFRIVGISACYSGGFLPMLRGQGTLVFSASRADRTSFGCGSDRDFTYFGEALFRDQIAHGVDIFKGLDAARSALATRERNEHLLPSEPQVDIGAGIREQVQKLATANLGTATSIR